ncbi:ABC transporter ATP-binding protein [Streptococcus pneumoniae]|nr:ABC transporter ATP-binding protein [Streptococcus pneumoniae]CGF78569.1 ABC transporter ATP-binding protein [Streptococcus pneumoniae]CGG78868.1 ABC transporter ATP-binding protein [Streptococcus pneumoniae]CIR93179.1 ABC transporter ATP-binding protein [Streptococcus pneumoniae]CIZ47539.1 ABC transporter ATP-binding protein [Streptococcus pneumoniae]
MSEIEIINAKKIYHDVPVIENLNITIPKGSLFTLLGASGCGKTTLLRMIAGFNSIKDGEFYFDPKFQVEVSHPKEIHLATCSPSIF